MKAHLGVCCVSIALILALGSSTTIAQAPAAKPPAASAPAAGAVAIGQAAGTLTAKGQSINLAHAAAFVDQQDKQVVLLLTEQPVPATSWKSHSDIMMYRMNKNPLRGIAFRLDDKRQVLGVDVYAGDFPTSTSGLFALKLDGPPGKTLAGTAKSTEAAAKMSEPMSLSVSFNATLK